METLLSSSSEVLLLHGLGGIGKTTIAKYFLSRHVDDTRYNFLCWIDYQGSLEESFSRQIDHTYDLQIYPLEEIYGKIVSDLSNFPGNNLLIIDGFDHPTEDDAVYLRYLPKNFQVIIISRNDLQSDIIKKYTLDTLAKEEAKELFFKHCPEQRLDMPGDSKMLETLFEKVGYHTLTIEIMAKTLAKDGRLTVQDLIGLEGKIHVHTEHPKVAQTALEEFLTQLFDLAEIPADEIYILQNLAILPSVDIYQEILEDLLQVKSTERASFIDRLHELADRGWLVRAVNENGRIVFRCHQIIQELFRHHAEYRPTFEICRNCIDSLAWKLRTEPKENPLEKAVWIPFAVSVLVNIQAVKDEVAALANNLGLRYRDMGDFPQALAYSNKGFGIYEQVLGKTHPNLALSYNNLGLIYRDMGDFPQALAYSNKALEIRERILKKDHPELAQSYNNIGLIYRDMKNFPQALDYSNKAFGIYELVLGKDHPNLAKSYNNIGLIYRDMGDFPQALAYSNKALEIRERVLAKDHPDLAQSYNNIGLIYRDMRNFSQALEYAKKDLAICEQVLGKDHPDLANSYHNMAAIYYDTNEYHKAKIFMDKAIVILQKNFPGGHPNLDTALRWRTTIEAKLGKNIL